ncbi:hypothetical protein [Flavobacterium sp. JP2137]|uniref:hypothetical protein n=1 Tax=Flavobacterium sp. JP2137 TaxID=3414510 RepID=UPI003D2FE553
MEQNAYKSLAQGLGIAGFILGILTLLISFIPCFGILAVVFGVFAIVVSTVGLGISIKHQQPKIFVIVALILAGIGCTVALLQYFVLAKFAKEMPMHYREERNYPLDTDTIYSDSEAAYYNDQDTIVYDNAE